METQKTTETTTQGPTKPRRTASREVRRRQLIDATIKSIAKFGFSGTTMNTITGFADLSTGLVNFHFKSKENLFVETLVFLAQEHREQWRKSLRNADLTSQAKLQALVDAHFHPRICNRQNLAVWYAFFGESRYRASYRTKIAEIDSERIRESERLCGNIILEGAYAEVDPMVVTRSLETFYDGLWLNILMYPKEYSRREAKTQIRIYLATVFPKHFSAKTASEMSA